MNLASARRHWKASLLAAAGVAGGVGALDWSEPAASVIAAAPIADGPASFGVPPTLPTRLVGRLRADPFAARSWAPPATAVTSPVPVPPVQAATVPAEPVAPPNPYRFAGTVHHEGMLRVVLAAGERIHLVKGGEVLDEVYRVNAVSRNAVTLVYLPLGTEHQLVYVPDAPATAATGQIAAAEPSVRP